MEIHNIVEDLVTATVKELFDDEGRTHRLGYCTCDQCRLDVVCYALNKLAPEYIVSGRGLAHASSEYQNNVQRAADAVALASEGWKKISQAKRPHPSHGPERRANHMPEPPVFNFPTIIGRLFDGTTFEPMDGIRISLIRDGRNARMIDPNWQNPCSLFSSTSGTFIFWPAPEKAETLGESRSVEFCLKASSDGFEELTHFFSIRVHGEASIQSQFSLQRQHALPDLMMFPKGDEDGEGILTDQ